MPAATTASSSSSSAKKYKLRSVGNISDPKLLPCAFFTSAQGCRSGDSCKFSHDTNLIADPELAAVSTTTTSTSKKVKFQEQNYIQMDDDVVSSESSDGEVESNHTTQTIKKQKVNPIPQVTDDSPFLSAEEIKKNKATAKKGTLVESNKNPFAKPSELKKQKSMNNAVTTTNAVATPNSVEAIKKPKRSKSLPISNTSNSNNNTVDFRAMNLPIASFTMPVADPPTSNGTKSNTSLATATTPVVVQDVTPKKVLPLPTSTPSGRKWLSMVQKTREHARYTNLYDLTKYMEQDKNAGYAIDSLWVRTIPFDITKEHHPQVIAVDCEMCETMDPVTLQKDHRALCRVSIVNVETDEVLLDTLVKPTWPVTNYRSWVNGITAEHLDNVQFTLRHAQAYLMALCTNETVIIGHAVHNDLAALRIDHTTVVDSACLYGASDSETAMVSLRDIVAHVLKIDMPEKHDSVNDARMAYKIVEHYRTKHGKVDSIPRSSLSNSHRSSLSFSSSSNGLRASDYESQLFVHRIQKNACDEAQLLQMFLSYTHVQPIKVDEIEYGNNTTSDNTNNMSGKTHVHFSSGRHGNLAFDSLDGKAVADASGRLQKKVFLKNGNYIRIRKMAYETSSSSTPTTTVPSSTSDGNKK